MDILYGIFLIWFGSSAVKNGFAFMTARDQFLKSGEEKYPDELISLRKKVQSSLSTLVVFLLLFIFDL